MEFLLFTGEDLRSWLFKIEQFFSMEKVFVKERVDVAAMQLEGEAIQLHLSFMRYIQYLRPATWNEYVMALVERFGLILMIQWRRSERSNRLEVWKNAKLFLRGIWIEWGYLKKMPSVVSLVVWNTSWILQSNSPTQLLYLRCTELPECKRLT